MQPTEEAAATETAFAGLDNKISLSVFGVQKFAAPCVRTILELFHRNSSASGT